jgi:transposase InsO family protein
MGTGRTDEFRKDAVRIALSSKDQDLIRGIISPTTHGQQSHVQHHAEPTGSRLPCTRAEPEPKVRAAKWAGDISYIWTREGWLYLALAIVLGPMAHNGASSAGPSATA